MIRLILRLLRIKDYEVCKSCETLKEQLAFERDEKKRLTDTLIAIVSPKLVVETPVQELKPVVNSAGLFSRRRKALEEKDRLEAKIIADTAHLGKPDNLKEIEKLEQEMGIEPLSVSEEAKEKEA